VGDAVRLGWVRPISKGCDTFGPISKGDSLAYCNRLVAVKKPRPKRKLLKSFWKTMHSIFTMLKKQVHLKNFDMTLSFIMVLYY
jgi:hypothetical protein